MMNKHHLWIWTLVLSFAMTSCSAGPEKGPSNGEVLPETTLPLEDEVATNPTTDSIPDTFDLATTPPPIETTMNTLRGTFVEIQEGDYLHFVVQDEQSKLQSFWIPSDMPQSNYMPFLTMKRKKGTKVEVVWQKVKRYIPEAEGEMELEEAVEIRVID